MVEVLSFKQIKLLIQQLRLVPEEQRDEVNTRIYGAIKDALNILGSFGFECVTNNQRCEDRLVSTYGNKDDQSIQYEGLLDDIQVQLISFKSKWELAHSHEFSSDDNPKFAQFERYYSFLVNIFNHLDSKKVWMISTYSTSIGRVENVLSVTNMEKSEHLDLDGLYADLYECTADGKKIEFLVILIDDINDSQLSNVFVHLINLKIQGCDSIVFDLSPSTERSITAKKLRFVHDITKWSVDVITDAFLEISEKPSLLSDLYEGTTSVSQIYMGKMGSMPEVPCQHCHYVVSIYDKLIEAECVNETDKGICGAKKAFEFGGRYSALLGVFTDCLHFVFTNDTSPANVLAKSRFVLAVKNSIK